MERVVENEDASKSVPSRAAGGVARAAALTKAERKEIAQKASLARWHKDMPQAIRDGVLTIGEIEIECAVLEGGTRVLSERALTKGFGGKRGGAHWRRKQAGEVGADLPVFLSAKNISSNLPKDLIEALTRPIMYKPVNGGRIGHGVEASLLPKICNALIDLDERELLHPSQIAFAEQAAILVRGLAGVGIVALVDEATGYQDIRPKDELRLILEAYISKELLPWTERFPEEFYREMFRLRNWPFSSLQYPKKGPQGPRYAGKLTNELIYDQLPPGVRQGLEAANPKTEKGYRRNKHHQLLTGDIGNPHLEKQVAVVTALMRGASNWKQFMKAFNRNFRPDVGEQTSLFADEEE
jgi:hypothetical protein